MTVDPEPCRSAIISAFPDLAQAALRTLTMGWDSLAIEADGRLIFKFPRSLEAERALRREASLLAVIRPHTSLPVPDLTLIEAPVLFSRHMKIPGEHLVAAQYRRLSPTARERLAENLARLHAELHALDAGAMRKAGALAIRPWQSPDAIRKRALPLVPKEHRAHCAQIVDAYEALPPDPLGTTYGFFDGHGWNMAFDHGHQRLNGVYDFADSGFGPLHQDFIYSAFVSPELTRLTVERYARLTARPLDLERITLLIGAHRLSELSELADEPWHVDTMRESVVHWIDAGR